MNAYQVRMYVIGCVLFAGCSSSGEGQANSEGQSESSQDGGSAGSATSTTITRPSADESSEPTASSDEDGGAVSEDESPGAAEQESGMPDDMTDSDASVMDAVNLIRNPSFEDGDMHWNIWGGATRSNAYAQVGEWSVEATRMNGAEQVLRELKAKGTYRLSGWGRTEDEEPLLIGVKDYGGEEVRLIFSTPSFESQSLEFTMGNASTTATVYVYKHGGSGIGHGDGLSLTLVDAPEATEPAIPTGEYRLVWSDEFDGEGPPDPSKWVFEEGFQRNEEIQWYQSDNAFQADGYLVFEGRKEERPNPMHVPGSNEWRERRPMIEYTSSSINSKGLFDFKYGRLEVRAKVTNFTGTWPAIWTLGVDCEWPSSGEVDIMENYGGSILANFAWGTANRWQAKWDSMKKPVQEFGPGWTDDFHVWQLDWTEDLMVISLDGTELNRVDLDQTINGPAKCNGQNPFRQPHYILLNLALGSNGGPVDDLAFPTRYYVDYVRVYQAE